MNYGTIELKNDQWIIKCEPHIRARLKRVFSQIRIGASDVLTIGSNDEICRDIEWVLERYPLEIVSGADYLHDQANKHRDDETRIEELLEMRHPPDAFELAKPPRSYQSQSATICELKRGLLIADDVGLGKTVTSICCMTKPENLPALVVTVTHLPHQWVEAIHEFAPKLKTHVIKNGPVYDLANIKTKQQSLFTDDNRLPDVIITSYSKLSKWGDTLAPLIRYVVFDEIQELRHMDSNKYRSASYIARRSDLRCGLSATPIHNYGGEFYSVVQILRPGALGTHDEFLREWCASGKRIQQPKTFGSYLRREAIMVRHTREDVKRELPTLSKIPYTIDSDPKELEKIKGNATELAKLILAEHSENKGQQFMASEEFSNIMRQATGLAKAPFVADFVKMILDEGQKVVLFGWHRAVYDIWKAALLKYRPLLYTGSETAQEKDKSKKLFTDTEDHNLLIMSLRAGAGTDGLQHVCNTVVFGELDWSPGVIVQDIGRVHRDGQENPVMAYFLLADGGADPIMSEVLGVKRGQIEGVINPASGLVEQLENVGGIRKLAQSYIERKNDES